MSHINESCHVWMSHVICGFEMPHVSICASYVYMCIYECLSPTACALVSHLRMVEIWRCMLHMDEARL